MFPSPVSSVTIYVPATSANLGPGYDCLGLALNLHNRVTITRTTSPGESPAHPMVAQIASLFFNHHQTNTSPFGFTWHIEGEVPRSRGLGSSVTVRLGVLMGLNALAGNPLNREILFNICTIAEGHPDNVAPAVFGGFALASSTQHFRFEVDPRLKAVIAIPALEVETSQARAALPTSIPHAEAAKNTANAAVIVAAFATGQYEKLVGAFHDYLHQPYRQHLIPGLFDTINAGIDAGALGGYLSGSGSTIACLTLSEDPQSIAQAMQAALAAKQISSHTHILTPDNQGAQVQL
ncbi:homoserine kinase [Phragmitibacter flavus]|uniref:Homoserine kinase n=1 Tax=Phragmitibacter flavus TaxID=2576071 RepID=A0A5R8KD86_9BACT|nr:homoserine kinase [Phragmitibacter flavus]